MNGRILYNAERLFINGVEMSGVQGASSSLDTQKAPLLVAGTGFYCQQPSGPLSNQFSFDRVFLANDPYTGFLFGEVTGYFGYETGSNGESQQVEFHHGRTQTYSIKCSVGQVATTSVSIENYGDFGATGTGIILSEATYPEVYIGKSSDLRISGFSEGESNRVSSVEWTMTIPYTSNQTIGTMFGPDSRRVSTPITIDTSISIDADDFRQESLQSLICDPSPKNLKFSFFDCGEVSAERTFNSPRSELKSSSFRSEIGSNGNLIFDLSFRTFVNTTGEAMACLNGVGI